MSDDVAGGGDTRPVLVFLSVVSLASLVFLVLPGGDNYGWVDVSAVSAAVVVIAAVLGFAAATGRPVLALAAGGLCLLAAVVRFISLAAGGKGIVGGSGSTMTLLAGLGLGFAVLGLLGRADTDRRR